MGETRRQPKEQDDSKSLQKFEEFRKRQAAKKAAKQQAVKEEINPNAAAAHARIDQKKIKIAMQAAKAAMAQKAKPNK